MLVHVRVQVHRVDEPMLGEAARQRGDGLADLLEPFAEVLPAMSGDEDEREPCPIRAQQPIQVRVDARCDPGVALQGDFHQQSIDDGVSSHGDGVVRDAFAQESRARRLGGREMQRDQRRGEPAVHLLGKRGPDVARSQPRLDVTDGNAPVEARQRCHHHRRGVSLDQRHVGVRGLQPSVDAVHQPGRETGQRLVGPHELEVRVHREAELIGHLLEHLPVLSGGHYRAAELRGATQRRDHRRELDRLRPRPHEDEDAPPLRHGHDWVTPRSRHFTRGGGLGQSGSSRSKSVRRRAACSFAGRPVDGGSPFKSGPGRPPVGDRI